MKGRHLPGITWRKTVWGLASLVVLVGWFLMLRPTALGGPVTYSIVSGHSMEPTFEPGDYVVARAQDGYEKGDVVMFEVPGGVIVHRIVGGSADGGFITRGDNNQGVDPWRPSGESILGEAWVHLPQLGKAVGVIRSPLGIGVMAWLVTTMAVLRVTTPRGRHRALARSGLHRRCARVGPTAAGSARNSMEGSTLTRHVDGRILPSLQPRSGRP